MADNSLRQAAIKELARRELARRQSEQSPADESGGQVEDFLRGTATGLRQGVESIAGIPGDVRETALGAGRWIGEKVGMPDKVMDKTEGLARMIPMPFLGPLSPTTKQIQKQTSKVVGEHYQPKGVAGEYGRTFGEFAPMALASPGGVARKIAMATVPAATSETAGQVARNVAPEIEPYARVGGALAGGALASRSNPLRKTVKKAAKGAPTTEGLREKVNKTYAEIRKNNIRYDADEFAQMADDLPRYLRKSGHRPVGDKKLAYDWVDEIASNKGKAPDFDDVDSLIVEIAKNARDKAKTPDGESTAEALNRILDKLMDFQKNANFTTSSKITKEAANELVGSAKSLAKQRIKDRVINDILETAQDYTSGFESGVRNQINSLLRSRFGRKLFSETEKNALREVANGRKGLQTLSRFGFDLTSLSGNATFIPTLGAIGAGAVLGPAVGAGLAVSGTAAKMAMPHIRDAAIKNAMKAVRSGKLASPDAAAEMRRLLGDKQIRRMLLAERSINAPRQ